jgi:serine/threonine protein kinase
MSKAYSIFDEYKLGIDIYRATSLVVDDSFQKFISPYTFPTPIPQDIFKSSSCLDKLVTPRIFKIDKYVEKIKTPTNTTIYFMNHTNVVSMLNKIESMQSSCDEYVLKPCFQVYNTLEPDTSYVVKKTPVKSHRELRACIREVMMNNVIYNSVWDGKINDVYIHQPIKGSDVTSKVYLNAVVFSGIQWNVYVVMEHVPGQTINKVRKKKIGINRENLLSSIRNTLRIFWLLGFVHHDIRDTNIIYNKTTNTCKLIDFESSVMIPSPYVDKYRNTYCNSKFKVSDRILFNSYYRNISYALLKLIEREFRRFTVNGILYNRDEVFISIMEEIL